MNEAKYELYWNDIPVGKENAVSYQDLTARWECNERSVRDILHDLSAYDNGDDFILIRSARAKGFYRTDDSDTIEAYKKECLNKGRSVFAPVRKINRVLNSNSTQMSIHNNLRVVRINKNVGQAEVCRFMKKYDSAFDKPLLSKMENGVCLPTPFQLSLLAKFYGCEPFEILNADLYL